MLIIIFLMSIHSHIYANFECDYSLQLQAQLKASKSLISIDILASLQPGLVKKGGGICGVTCMANLYLQHMSSIQTMTVRPVVLAKELANLQGKMKTYFGLELADGLDSRELYNALILFYGNKLGIKKIEWHSTDASPNDPSSKLAVTDFLLNTNDNQGALIAVYGYRLGTPEWPHWFLLSGAQVRNSAFWLELSDPNTPNESVYAQVFEESEMHTQKLGLRILLDQSTHRDRYPKEFLYYIGDYLIVTPSY